VTRLINLISLQLYKLDANFKLHDKIMHTPIRARYHISSSKNLGNYVFLSLHCGPQTFKQVSLYIVYPTFKIYQNPGLIFEGGIYLVKACARGMVDIPLVQNANRIKLGKIILHVQKTL